MGCCYRHGDGVKKDAAKAMEWYEKASELGETDAMLSLGRMYECGEGVKKDLQKAAQWYRKAQEKGAEGAEYLLSRKKFANLTSDK